MNKSGGHNNNSESLVTQLSNYISNTPEKRSELFTSIEDISDELQESSEEVVFFGVYCITQDLLLYSKDSKAHRILDFYLTKFLKEESLSCSQNELLFHNICNSPGKKRLNTKFDGIYVSTFSGKNHRTFGNFYLPKPLENILLNNIR